MYNGEFVAPEAPNEIRPAYRRMQACPDALEKSIAHWVTKIIVHVFEVIEVDPVHCETVTRPKALQGGLELLMKMEAVRNLSKRVVAREPGNLLFCLTPLSDVFLQVHPTAIGERLVGDENGAPARQVLRVRKGFATCELGHVLRYPLTL